MWQPKQPHREAVATRIFSAMSVHLRQVTQ